MGNRDTGIRTPRPQPLLQIKNLDVSYHVPGGRIQAVAGINLQVSKGDTLGLVGESGCGKSTTAMAILRLIKPPGYIERGEILLKDQDVLALPLEEMRQIRGRQLALIPQGAMNSLSPVTKIKEQLMDGIVTHRSGTKREAIERVETALDMVGLPNRVLNMYPHELSGGMKQRVCIAMAISLNPELIIADEPTSALDVVAQRVVSQTLVEVKEKLGSTLITIGHDMGLMAQMANRIAIMYAGRIVEVGPISSVYAEPLHPYTRLLIVSVPSIHEKRELRGIPGLPPSLLEPPAGCVFNPRCPEATPLCRSRKPVLQEMEPGHFAACHLLGKTEGTMFEKEAPDYSH